MYSVRKNNVLDAIFSLFRTLFVCIVLTAGALYFSQDATDLVLTPISNMLNKIKLISKNPLMAAEMEEKQAMLDL